MILDRVYNTLHSTHYIYSVESIQKYLQIYVYRMVFLGLIISQIEIPLMTINSIFKNLILYINSLCVSNLNWGQRVELRQRDGKGARASMPRNQMVRRGTPTKFRLCLKNVLGGKGHRT